MTIHRLDRNPTKSLLGDDPPDHEILTFAEFAKRRGIKRQTAYKWKDQPNGFPPKSLLQDHRGRWFVDYTVYKNSMVVVR